MVRKIIWRLVKDATDRELERLDQEATGMVARLSRSRAPAGGHGTLTDSQLQ